MLAIWAGLGILGLLFAASGKRESARTQAKPQSVRKPMPREERVAAVRRAIAQGGSEHESMPSKALRAVQQVKNMEASRTERESNDDDDDDDANDGQVASPGPAPARQAPRQLPLTQGTRPAPRPAPARPAPRPAPARPALPAPARPAPAPAPRPVPARPAPAPAPRPVPARPAPVPMRTAPVSSKPAERPTPLAERVARDIYAKGRQYDHKILEEYQRSVRLAPDGLYGQKSYDALMKSGIKKPPPVIFGAKRK